MNIDELEKAFVQFPLPPTTTDDTTEELRKNCVSRDGNKLLACITLQRAQNEYYKDYVII